MQSLVTGGGFPCSLVSSMMLALGLIAHARFECLVLPEPVSLGVESTRLHSIGE